MKNIIFASVFTIATVVSATAQSACRSIGDFAARTASGVGSNGRTYIYTFDKNMTKVTIQPLSKRGTPGKLQTAKLRVRKQTASYAQGLRVTFGCSKGMPYYETQYGFVEMTFEK
jgi:hypothetical protein